jgi:hypothetical protein
MNIKILTNKWFITILLLLIVIIMLHSFMLRIFVRWGAAFISFSAVACVFYAFIGIFPSFKKPIVKLILTACMIGLCIFAYYEFNKPKVVQMKEDVMYILPKSKVEKSK